MKAEADALAAKSAKKRAPRKSSKNGSATAAQPTGVDPVIEMPDK